MRRDRKEIRQFNAMVTKLSGERSVRESYEITERYYKRKKGKRFYKNYRSFLNSRSYHIRSNNFSKNKRRFNELFSRI